MPKRAPDPILDRTDAETQHVHDYNTYLDGLVADARRCVAGHPDFGHLDPDMRITASPGKSYVPKRAAEVMLKALKKTDAGKAMNAATRRGLVKTLLQALREEQFDVVGDDQLARDTTETNSHMLMMASGWYVLRDGVPFYFEPVMRTALAPAVAQPKPAPLLPPTAPADERWIDWKGEEEEPEPDVNEMLKMMGNLPPLHRSSH